MLKLSNPIIKVPNIGPKYKTLLADLGIETVEDLLFYFPFRYEDLSNIKNIDAVQAGETVTLKGTLAPINNIFTKNGKRLSRSKLIDNTGTIDTIWFNQHYLQKTLNAGAEYYLSGKVDLFDKKPCLISPEIEPVKDNSLHTGRLVPVYAETAGVSSKWLRTKINDIIQKHLEFWELPEYLPQKLIEKNNFENLTWCLKNIHFPDSHTNLIKSRERFAFEELFLELLNVESKKQIWQRKITGLPLKPFENDLTQFINTLPFKLTDSQNTAVNHIVKQMQYDIPMNMLLEGDVGSGKTMVAILAAYFTHLNGYKTLYMAPTEILSQQHHQSFKKFLANTSIKIELSTSTNKLKTNDWDILIGTHALLHSKETYNNIGLVIIDEQHRFGVEQRGKIIEMTNDKHKPHFLAMTATPIPRTLALTIFGDLDIVALKEHPHKERDIATKVLGISQREEAYKWIREKNEPTFIVCPFIEISETENLANVKAAQAEFMSLQKGTFADVPIGLIHGKMTSTEKQEVINKFKTGEIRVLVATPVIEVGVDIPEATIMVIESAERYGLASLHQLRGRVGRGINKGYCFVVLSTYSKNSYERLKYLEKINNGLELAEIDMKMRGQGDVFGTMQHGFKKFKVASLDNLELIESAKIAAQEIYPELDNYLLLKEMLHKKGGIYVKNN